MDYIDESCFDAAGKALGVVRDALSRIRFGAIQLTVHDGKVMQIDVTERKRLTD